MANRMRSCSVLLIAGVALLLAIPAAATCWVCLFDSGIGQNYCQSVGDQLAATHCTPISGQYCDISGEQYCEADLCQCYRYPALPVDIDPALAVRNSAGVLLFRGLTPEDQDKLVAALPDAPIAFDMRGDLVTPSVALDVLNARGAQGHLSGLELAGYTAVTKRGPASSRLIGEDGEGILVDTRPASTGQHIRVSQLLAQQIVTSSEELSVEPGQATLCRVRMGGVTYACVIWATHFVGQHGLGSELHEQFTNAADTFPARHIATFSSDSPDIRRFALGGARATRSPWGKLALSYR